MPPGTPFQAGSQIPRTKRITPIAATPYQVDAGSPYPASARDAVRASTDVVPSSSIALPAGAVGADELLRPGERLGGDRALRASERLDEVLHPNPLHVDRLRDRRGGTRGRMDHPRRLGEQLRPQGDQLRLSTRLAMSAPEKPALRSARRS